jgi:hypothetical protein
MPGATGWRVARWSRGLFASKKQEKFFAEKRLRAEFLLRARRPPADGQLTRKKWKICSAPRQLKKILSSSRGSAARRVVNSQ